MMRNNNNPFLHYCTDLEKPRPISSFYAKSAPVPTTSETAPVDVTVGNNDSLTAEVLRALKVVSAH